MAQYRPPHGSATSDPPLILAVTVREDNAPQPRPALWSGGQSRDSVRTAQAATLGETATPKEHTVHTQSPTTILDTAVARPVTTSRTTLRTGSTMLLGGLVAE